MTNTKKDRQWSTQLLNGKLKIEQHTSPTETSLKVTNLVGKMLQLVDKR